METDRSNSVEERAGIEWIRATDGVLKGLNHAFSNHISLVRLLSQLVREGEVVDAELQQVAEEAGRLDQLLTHYRLLPFAAGESAEPIRVLDVTNEAIEFFRRHDAMRDVGCVVEGDQDTPPVLLNPAALTQAVALLLFVAARRTRQDASSTGLLLRYGGDADWVRVAAETRESPPGVEDGDANELAAVRWLIRDAEGSAEVARLPGGGISAAMRLGTLKRLRQGSKR